VKTNYRFMKEAGEMYGKMLLVWVLGVLVCTCNLMADVVTIYPSDDATVDSYSPGTNYGSSSSVSAGYGVLSAGVRRAYLKFDLSSVPAGRKIVSARVRLDASYVSIPAPGLGAHYLADDTWGEGTITWNNAPTVFEANASDTVTVSIDVDYWTVTEDVFDAYRNDGVFSVVMKSTNEGSATAAIFYSQEAILSDWWPRLEVEYVVEYSGGSGTSQYPYLIATADDMNAIGVHPEDWDANFLMTADINLAAYTGTQFSIIGDGNTAFSGVFDGNGHTISNFTYQSDGENSVGLFGKVSTENSLIKDVGLIHADVNGGSGIAVGALVGAFGYGSISGCSCIDCSVFGADMVGTLVGLNASGTISDCYATGWAQAADSAGGLVGTNGGSILDSHAAVEVTGGGACGGFVGFQNSNGSILDCYATGDVTAVSDSVGGFAGGSYGTISNCYATGNAEGELAVGGLTGMAGFNSATTGCYAEGSASGTGFVGGLAGYLADGDVSNSHARGTVVGEDIAGGLIGIAMKAEVSYCYAAGLVHADSNVGGLVGLDGEDTWAGTFAACFWDSDINPDVNGIGNKSEPNVVGKTTAEMQTESTFTDAGWDFVGTWGICEGTNYPRLLWEIPAGDFVCPDGVSFVDFGYLAARWGDVCCSCDHCQGADLDLSGVVDWPDVKIFCDDWLEGLH
jgi:hypothetical protein